MSFQNEIPQGGLQGLKLEDLQGLRPRAWLCVGEGFSREDVKDRIFSQGVALVGNAITSVRELCQKVLRVDSEKVLGNLARQEILRVLLAEPKINASLPELKRLRRQSQFFKKLDRSIQSARLAFAHEEEGLVYNERLEGRFGKSPVREEIQRLSGSYEAFLEGTGVWDEPLLLARASEALKDRLPEGVLLPEKIIHLSAEQIESRERDFWESLERFIQVERVGLEKELLEEAYELSVPSRWERWHTLDDAADALAERLAESVAQADTPNFSNPYEQIVLIPDHPSVRRSVMRALEQWGVPLADPRDPTRLKWDEGLKWALAPLETVARGYDRARVIAWLRGAVSEDELPALVSEINSRGIRRGLPSFSGGILAQVQTRLKELESALGGKRRCEDLGEAHLKLLRAQAGAGSPRAESLQWLIPFFEKVWKDFAADTLRIGQDQRRAPALYWLERLQARLQDMTPPVEKLKPARGVKVHRLGHAPIQTYSKVWLLGLPPGWLSAESTGDYWFSEREREVLSGEFAVRSGIQLRGERLATLRMWLKDARSVTVLDAEYDWDGRERETLFPLLKELGFPAELEPESKGSHSRWRGSYRGVRGIPPLQFELPPLSEIGRKEIRASEIDHYSHCGFVALARSRWRLNDIREPGMELWPEVRGNILHGAVKLLLTSRDENGSFGKSVSEALDEAWASNRPKGLLKGSRLEAYVKSKFKKVLETFCEKEREYFDRAKTRILSLEGPELRIEFEDFAIIGIPDRIDENEEGIFVLDYKTTSRVSPKGKDMVEQGYRLQLPFYALAAGTHFGKDALGVQFVELNTKGGRSSGIFFKAYNGKEPGKLTNARSNNGSLLAIDPKDAWAQCQDHLLSHAKSYFNGQFAAKPKKEAECKDCFLRDLCGHRRVGSRDDSARDDTEGGTE